MNNVSLVGHLTKDVELKFIPGSGTAVANFTLAVNKSFKKEGQADADFIPIVVFGKQAEATANYMGKGSQVGVIGNIQTRNYEAKDGTERYVTEIIAEHVIFMDSKKSTDEQNSRGSSLDSNPDVTPVSDDEIPF